MLTIFQLYTCLITGLSTSVILIIDLLNEIVHTSTRIFSFIFFTKQLIHTHFLSFLYDSFNDFFLAVDKTCNYFLFSSIQLFSPSFFIHFPVNVSWGRKSSRVVFDSQFLNYSHIAENEVIICVQAACPYSCDK